MSAARALMSPPRFLAWSRRWGPRLLLLAGAFAVPGLWVAFFVAPPDARQGEVYRLLYLHVPAAWMSMLVYLAMALHGAAGLVWRTKVSFAMVRGLAPTGAGYTLLALVTGSLWGQPTWGTWWAWDARLTSELVLLMLYLGVIALQSAFADRDRGERAAALLCVAGVANLPIIYFSVVWWNTLHQGATLSPGGGAQMAPAMLLALLAMTAAAWLHAAGAALVRAHVVLRERLRQEDRLAAERARAPAGAVLSARPMEGAT